MSKKALGRGLNELIAGGISNPDTVSQDLSYSEKEKQSIYFNEKKFLPDYKKISLDKVKLSPYQPRKNVEKKGIEVLAKSILEDGLLQPINVRKTKKGNYELISGERRLQAFKKLKWKKIPAHIIDVADSGSAVLALVENLQRENLNPIEEAFGYQILIEKFKLTQEAVADRIGSSSTTTGSSAGAR